MNKFNKNKAKKAAKVAANANAAAAALQKKIADEKCGAGAAVDGGASPEKPVVDAAYHKTLKKIIGLTDRLSNGLVIKPNSSKEQKSDEEGDSNSSDSSKFCRGQMGLKSLDDNPKVSRGEKKARRLLMKLDLKPINDVYRVTMKKSKNIILIIENPDVFMCPTGTIIVFGKVLVEDQNNKAATQAAERYREVEAFKEKGSDKAAATAGTAETAAVDDDVDDGDGVDENAAQYVDEKDIELVQLQAACSRKKAIKALLQNGHDVVNAIMDLTMG